MSLTKFPVCIRLTSLKVPRQLHDLHGLNIYSPPTCGSECCRRRSACNQPKLFSASFGPLLIRLNEHQLNREITHGITELDSLVAMRTHSELGDGAFKVVPVQDVEDEHPGSSGGGEVLDRGDASGLSSDVGDWC
jgi:hypothetical protein